MLPPVGLAVHLLPLEPDHVDEQSFGEPVPAHDGGREPPALVGEVQAAVAVQLDVSVIAEPADRLRHRRGRQAEAFDEAGPHRHDALFLDGEDRLEVLLGRVVHLGHALRLRKMRSAMLSVDVIGLAVRRYCMGMVGSCPGARAGDRSPAPLGQHFLGSAAARGAPRRRRRQSDRDDRVVDLGAGTGVLTARARRRTRGSVLAVEIDPGLAAGLARRFAGAPNVIVLHGRRP